MAKDIKYNMDARDLLKKGVIRSYAFGEIKFLVNS